MYKKKQNVPLVLLIVANSIPLLGVLLFEWSLFAIVFFYWLETIIVGLINVPKIIMAKGKDVELEHSLRGWSPKAIMRAYVAKKTFSIPFFLFHFGIFSYVHGFAIFSLFGPIDIGVLEMVVGGISFFMSHAVSFKRNYVDKKEYMSRNVIQQMKEPYKRVGVLHIIIIFGAVFVSLSGASIWAVVVLIVCKTSMDMFFHAKEHNRKKILDVLTKHR